MLGKYYFLAVETPGEISEGIESEEYVLDVKEEIAGKFVPQGLPTTHVVAKGEHLWKISEKYYGNGYNWVDIASENNISNPNILYEDQALTIPKEELRVPIVREGGFTVEEIASTIPSDTYSVSKGDTLWDIAVRAYQDGYKWPTIYQANREVIKDPNVIETGMELKLPR